MRLDRFHRKVEEEGDFLRTFSTRHQPQHFALPRGEHVGRRLGAGALLRYSLGLEYAKAGERARAIEFLRDAVARDPLYSAAWKALGGELTASGDADAALDAYRRGIEAAREKGDRQAEKEMTVFARRLEKTKG
jgi:tetratricopeptide (TPR) repeat protein